MAEQGLTYAQAGVSISAGDEFADMIAHSAETFGLPDTIGGFAGLFLIPPGTDEAGGSTDGVGTKMMLLLAMDKPLTAGRDAVAMAGVDLYVAGMRPVAVLDYLVVEHLDPKVHIKILDGVMAGCQLLGNIPLVGGETAEHPNVGLPKGYADIGVFVVGVPDPGLPVNPMERIQPGMKVWGWLSYGLGSNGYSLARRVFGLYEGWAARVLRAMFGGEYGEFSRIRRRLDRYEPSLRESLGGALLKCTRIYIRDIEELRTHGVEFAGHAHITGGGMPGNIPRVLPKHCTVEIDENAWKIPPIFDLIQHTGGISTEEMRRVFNRGIQMVSFTPASTTIEHPDCVLIGEVRERKGQEPRVWFKNGHEGI
ncbi:MAG: phosphoribosylformylglycinamidine cyclo-ligase [Parcubacteria group bacterium]|nr:phosphoribosylformylglycinamidine cyclo-ligase [Parcubacteria group bacterium]